MSRRIRIHRGSIRAKLRRGELRVTPDLLADPDLRTMQLGDLLNAVPRLGDVRVAQRLNRLWISPTKRIGDLTPRQRRLVAATVHRPLRRPRRINGRCLRHDFGDAAAACTCPAGA